MSWVENQLTKLDFWTLQKNYEFAQALKESDSRIVGLATSVICGLSAAEKITTDLAKTVIMLGKSAYNGRLETGNIQVGAVNISHIARHVLGTVAGSAVALASPKRASELFLTQDSSILKRTLNPDKAAKVYALGAIAQRWLAQYGIECRMTAGTFLGAIRHEGIFAWDDDIDLFLPPEAEKILEAVVGKTGEPVEIADGVCIKWFKTTGQGWHVYFADGEETKHLEGTKFPFIDLFATKQDEKTGRISYSSPHMVAWASQEYFTESEWNDSKVYNLGPIEVVGPKDPKPYFNRCFGEPAMDFAYLLYHHDTFKVERPPQWVYIADHKSIEYNAELFESLTGDLEFKIKPAD